MKATITIIFLIVSTLTFSQFTHKTWKQDTTQQTILKQTSGYDKLIFVEYASFWGDDSLLNGIGFKDTCIYYVQLELVKTVDERSTFHCIKKAETKIQNSNSTKVCYDLDWESMINISNDSIQYYRDPKSDASVSISDCTYSTLILVDHSTEKLHLKQTYCPRFYQKRLPTKDREYLVQVMSTVSDILKEEK